MSIGERLQPPTTSSSQHTICSFPGEEGRGRTPTRTSTIPASLDVSPHPLKTGREEEPTTQRQSWWRLLVEALVSPFLTAAIPFAATPITPPDSASLLLYEALEKDQQQTSRGESPPARRISSRQVQIPDYTPFPAFESYNPPPLYRLLSRSLSRSRSHTEPKTALLRRKVSQDAEDRGQIVSVDHDVWLRRTNGQPLVRNFSRLERLRREG